MSFGERLLPHRTSGAPAAGPQRARRDARRALLPRRRLPPPGAARLDLIGTARDNWDDLDAYAGLNVITVLDAEHPPSRVRRCARAKATGSRSSGTRTSSDRYADDFGLEGRGRARAQPRCRRSLLNRETRAPRRSSYRLGRASRGRRCGPARCSTGSSCSPSSGRAGTAAPRTPSCRRATSCSSKATGARWTRSRAIRTCSSSTPRSWCAGRRCRMGARSREAVVVLVRHGRAARHRRRAGRRSPTMLAAGAMIAAARRVGPAGLPRDLVDHGAARRRA